MTITQRKLAFDQALQSDDMVLLLVTFLHLIAAAQTIIHTSVEQIQPLVSAQNPDFYADSMQRLLQCDMLAYISVASQQQTIALRILLDTATPDLILGWYRTQWSQRDMQAEHVLVSIASGLRSAMTVIYGNIDLLRQNTSNHPEKENAYQVITEAVDHVRSARTQLSRPLAAHGLGLQAF